jgi:hypothetical protein
LHCQAPIVGWETMDAELNSLITNQWQIGGEVA